MVGANKIGEAEIEVKADTKKADAQLQAFRRRLEQTGRGYDKLFKEDITRKFSENFRKGFEVGVLRGVEKGENQFFQLNRGINVAATSLRKVKGAAETAADGFMKLQRTGLKMQAALGTIAGTIGDLIGGLLSVVGVLGAAAPAAVALGGAMASVGIGFVGVKVAMAGVSNAISTVWKSQTALNDTFRAATQEYIGLKFAAEEAALSQEDAALKLEVAREALARVQDLPPDNRLRRQTELAFKQADLQLRETKHKSEESFRAVKKGITATSAYQPLAALSDVQLQFVKFMVAFRPQMQTLKKEVAAGFIPKLTESINTVMKYGFPIFKQGLKEVASAMGNATKTFASAFKNPENMQQLAGFFKSSTGIIKSFGSATKSSFGILITLLHAAEPITKRFADWVDKYLKDLDKKVKVGSFTGSLQRMFDLAGDVSARLGKIFKEVFGGIKNIIDATFPSGAKSGAGGVLLDFLEKITKGFQDFTGNKSFSNWLENSTKGAVAALTTIGKFLGIFTDLAGNKATKEFWTTLQQAVPYVKTILENGQSVGVQLSGILVDIAKILAAFADAGTLNTFFNSLKVIFDAFANFADSPAVKWIMGWLGSLHGPLLAVGAVLILAKKGLEIFLGYLAKFANIMGSATMKVRAGQQAQQTWNREMKLGAAAGESFWQRVRRASANANNQKLLAMGREAGFAKDRLAQLELQMISNSRTATLFNEKTQESTHLMELDAAQAEQLSDRIVVLAKRQGMEKEQLKQLSAQLKINREAMGNSGTITNQELLNGTGFENGSYKAPFLNMNKAGAYGQPSYEGGANPGLVLTGGKPGFKAAGAGIKGLFSGMGKGAIAGGIGMGATAISGLVGLGSGTMGPVGMATQAISGIASMFGPTGMVIGGLLSVGGTIVDGIMAAEAERQKGIKEFKIVTANMSVENLNTIKGFASKATAAGFVSNKMAAELRATAFENSAINMADKTSLNAKTLQYSLNAFALSNKRAYDLAGVESNRNALITAVDELKKTSPNLQTTDISGALGSLSSITAKTQDSILQGLQETGLIGKGNKASLIKDLAYNDKGVLTSASFQKLLTDVINANKGQKIVTDRSGTAPTSTNKDLQTTKFIPLNSNQIFSPTRYGQYTGDYGTDLGNKLTNYKLAPGLGDMAPQFIGDLLTNKNNGVKVLPNGRVEFSNEEAKSQAAVSISGFAKLLTGVSGGNITQANRTYYTSGGKFISPDQLENLRKTNKYAYDAAKGTGRVEQGFNVAGQFFTQEMFDAALKKIKVKTPDGKTVNAFEAGLGDKVLDITKISTATQATIKTGNPILDAASATAAVQAKTFTTASGDIKTSAASIGTAAAKFEGYGELIAGNTNKAIAFAIISNTKAGKAAIDSGDQDRVNNLLTQELSKLGLSIK